MKEKHRPEVVKCSRNAKYKTKRKPSESEGSRSVLNFNFAALFTTAEPVAPFTTLASTRASPSITAPPLPVLHLAHLPRKLPPRLPVLPRHVQNPMPLLPLVLVLLPHLYVPVALQQRRVRAAQAQHLPSHGARRALEGQRERALVRPRVRGGDGGGEGGAEDLEREGAVVDEHDAGVDGLAKVDAGDQSRLSRRARIIIMRCGSVKKTLKLVYPLFHFDALIHDHGIRVHPEEPLNMRVLVQEMDQESQLIKSALLARHVRRRRDNSSAFFR
mmetsp:Transcript_6945/g.17040  ORF Transcript_6945/g.17040 Transcript_6945/m.17040 type:complete len:273 (+) Transcript_6945:548-1366(+)|eukprot:CAMPEP_0174901830 /NCGR_PEP_ID=MMETSP0167-20121228/35886_1 /TAXON_ID=38298 /ORGANISM="Rhodella maculata, Strain CCMP736" /LENGTH=272 /DNA_ID=CAMNT_0016143637 /DNA_START=523 /DNA_END=1341 /DNA_ORIENTATION=+